MSSANRGKLRPHPCTHGYRHKRRNCPTCVERDRLLGVLRAARMLLRKAAEECASEDPADHLHWLDPEIRALAAVIGDLDVEKVQP